MVSSLTKADQVNMNALTFKDIKSSSIFSLLPEDVSMYLLDYIAERADKPTLCSLIRVNHAWYDHFSPKLYAKIEMNKANHKKVLFGLDHTIDDKARWSKKKSNRKKSYEQALQSHHRKLHLLNNVKTLIISDFSGAEAIAHSLNPLYTTYIKEDCTPDRMARRPMNYKGEQKPLPVPKCSSLTFNNLQNIVLGYKFLTSDELYPHCAHSGDPEAHPVVSVLASGLDCKNICYDYKAGKKFHKDDEGFSTALGNLVTDWNFKSSTWHHMDQRPFGCTHSRPKVKLFVTDVAQEYKEYARGTDGQLDILRVLTAHFIDYDYWCCAHPRKDEQTNIEIAYPGYNYQITPEEIMEVGLEIYEACFWSETSGEDDFDDCLEATKKRWEERKSSGWFEKYLKIVELDDAEPCICCGEK